MNINMLGVGGYLLRWRSAGSALRRLKEVGLDKI